MRAVRRPEMELRPAGERFGPRDTDRRDRRPRRACRVPVPVDDALLHRRVGVAGHIAPVAGAVRPRDEQERLGAARTDPVRQVRHVRGELPRSVVVGERRNLALLLQDDDVPADFAQQAVEPAITRELAQLPPWRSEGTGEDRDARAAEAMNEPRQVVLEREAVPHEEHTGSSTVAACEPEVARGDGREWVADDPDLDEARVHGDAEQDSGGEDERCAAESSHARCLGPRRSCCYPPNEFPSGRAGQ